MRTTWSFPLLARTTHADLRGFHRHPGSKHESTERSREKLLSQFTGSRFEWFVLALVTGVDDPRFSVAGAAAVQLEQRRRRHQVAELGIAVAARVEVGPLLGDDVPDARQRRPAVVVRRRLDGVAELVHQR